MIDMHTHILPNVDDGAKSIEEANALVQEAKQVGFDEVVSTSHYIEGYYEVANEERQNYINQLSKENNNFKIHLANEIYLSENILNLIEQKKVSTINNTNYILFEMPFSTKPIALYNIIYELLQNKYIPILAHPERYTFIQEQPGLVYELIEKGLLMQGNFGSIMGQYGKKAQIIIQKLLQNNMIHFLGTDVHKPQTIYPKIPQIMEQLKQMIGREKLYEITTINPKLILQNKRLQVIAPIEEIKFTLKEKLILNLRK